MESTVAPSLPEVKTACASRSAVKGGDKGGGRAVIGGTRPVAWSTSAENIPPACSPVVLVATRGTPPAALLRSQIT